MIYTDQLQRKIDIRQPPRRIISLVPSQTELLAYLGLEREVVGITKFCVHPQRWFKEKQRIGGTKKLHLDRIRELRPDLIIGNKEENDPSQVKKLMQEFPVWISDIKNLADALDMIREIGRINAKETTAEALIADTQQVFIQLAHQLAGKRPVRAAYLIWNQPIMVAGGDTFIHSMLHRAGYENVFQKRARYPEVKPEELVKAKPEVLLLSSEPFPFKEKHLEHYRSLLPEAKVLLVNGELFSWYGSRLKLSAPYFQQLRKKTDTFPR